MTERQCCSMILDTSMYTDIQENARLVVQGILENGSIQHSSINTKFGSAKLATQIRPGFQQILLASHGLQVDCDSTHAQRSSGRILLRSLVSKLQTSQDLGLWSLGAVWGAFIAHEAEISTGWRAARDRREIVAISVLKRTRVLRWLLGLVPEIDCFSFKVYHASSEGRRSHFTRIVWAKRRCMLRQRMQVVWSRRWHGPYWLHLHTASCIWLSRER